MLKMLFSYFFDCSLFLCCLLQQLRDCFLICTLIHWMFHLLSAHHIQKGHYFSVLMWDNKNPLLPVRQRFHTGIPKICFKLCLWLLNERDLFFSNILYLCKFCWLRTELLPFSFFFQGKCHSLKLGTLVWTCQSQASSVYWFNTSFYV